ARQQRFRDRQKQKVTHQGCPPPVALALLLLALKQPPESPQAYVDRQDLAVMRCRFFGLTDDFARDTQKQTQWQAFVGKNRLEALELEVLVAALRDFLLPAIAAANADTHFPQRWPAGGPWTPVAA
ncbi:MAG: hypothetical protein WD942_11085, partial [Dehalococcoidia bacterium]